MELVEYLREKTYIPDWFTETDICASKLDRAFEDAILSLGTFTSARKREATYRFILECYDRLQKYNETRPNPETFPNSEKRPRQETTGQER